MQQNNTQYLRCEALTELHAFTYAAYKNIWSVFVVDMFFCFFFLLFVRRQPQESLNFKVVGQKTRSRNQILRYFIMSCVMYTLSYSHTLQVWWNLYSGSNSFFIANFVSILTVNFTSNLRKAHVTRDSTGSVTLAISV